MLRGGCIKHKRASSPYRTWQRFTVAALSACQPLCISSLCRQTIVWLDALAARVRYSLWIDGQLPEVVRWDSVFHARGAVAQRRRAREGEDEEVGRVPWEVNARGGCRLSERAWAH